MLTKCVPGHDGCACPSQQLLWGSINATLSLKGPEMNYGAWHLESAATIGPQVRENAQHMHAHAHAQSACACPHDPFKNGACMVWHKQTGGEVSCALINCQTVKVEGTHMVFCLLSLSPLPSYVSWAHMHCVKSVPFQPPVRPRMPHWVFNSSASDDVVTGLEQEDEQAIQHLRYVPQHAVACCHWPASCCHHHLVVACTPHPSSSEWTHLSLTLAAAVQPEFDAASLCSVTGAQLKFWVDQANTMAGRKALMKLGKVDNLQQHLAAHYGLDITAAPPPAAVAAPASGVSTLFFFLIIFVSCWGATPYVGQYGD